ncbi:hypothetical protein VFSR5_0159 [Aliivibrio fischeri SR5]|uniref:Uncharacterized protein n=1 Tax=Aliivibrio fischeri SR5 TaxID=1088719 RepID=A0AAV3EX61_ALIFS|nr:hypothetical protein VFSR5_0159 [Aliivibrio fischeri SR5]
MSHIYFNTQCPNLIESELLKYKKNIKFNVLGNDVSIFFEPNLWVENEPVYKKIIKNYLSQVGL